MEETYQALVELLLAAQVGAQLLSEVFVEGFVIFNWERSASVAVGNGGHVNAGRSMHSRYALRHCTREQVWVLW